MAKSYYLTFGHGDPRTFTGLAPTLVIFKLADGTNVTAPAITEVSTTGIYTFSWGTTTSIAFIADGATTGLLAGERYTVGNLDPADRIDEVGTTLAALGTTSVAWGSANSTALTNVGTTLVAIGNTTITYNAAINTALTNIGTTLVAIGNTSITKITNNGTTLVSIGDATATSFTNTGATLVAIGNTAITALTNEGATLVAIGNTSIAYGGTILAKVTTMGTTLVAIGNSIGGANSGIGSTASSYGDSTTDPVDLFGYMKRIQENLEGNSTYTKGTGVWAIKSRASATLLISKTITNSATTVTKL